MLRYEIIETCWGPFVAVGSERGLIGTLLPDDDHVRPGQAVAERWPDAIEADWVSSAFRNAVRDYFLGKRVAFRTRPDLTNGTEFRQSVMRACRQIPYGQFASYADLARASGRSSAVRAVGTTMAHNPLPLIVPCHRVVRSDGTIGGFSSPSGVHMKRRLLALEGIRWPID